LVGKKFTVIRTSRNLPDATFANAELNVGHIDADLSRRDEEEHMHFPRIFGSLEAISRNVDNAATKEG
jgi:hypothetical protein